MKENGEGCIKYLASYITLLYKECNMKKLLYTTPELSIVVVENDILATNNSTEAGAGYPDNGMWD